MDEARLYLRPNEWYAENNVELLLSQRAISVDTATATVKLDNGKTLPYDRLVIATGSRPRQLPVPSANLKNVFDLRTLDDVQRIREQLSSEKKLAIIGAGYIGLEAAAVARQLGLEVTVIEMAERILARVTSPVISAFYQSVHESHGVNFFTNARLSALRGKDGAIVSAVLEDGAEIDADIALVGIGISPNDTIAADAGIECQDGIVVDRDGRTNNPAVFAAGDCARRPLVHYSGSARLESVHNAIEQGKLVAAAILDRPRPREEAPWFWSDQYDLKLQIAGLSVGFNDHVIRGDIEARKFAVFYFDDEKLLAVDAVGAPGEFLQAKKWIADGQTPDRSRLKDASVSIKEIAQDMK